MHHIRVHLEDGNHIDTEINPLSTRASILSYYEGKFLNVGTVEDNMQRVKRVEFLFWDPQHNDLQLQDALKRLQRHYGPQLSSPAAKGGPWIKYTYREPQGWVLIDRNREKEGFRASLLMEADSAEECHQLITRLHHARQSKAA